MSTCTQRVLAAWHSDVHLGKSAIAFGRQQVQLNFIEYVFRCQDWRLGAGIVTCSANVPAGLGPVLAPAFLGGGGGGGAPEAFLHGGLGALGALAGALPGGGGGALGGALRGGGGGALGGDLRGGAGGALGGALRGGAGGALGGALQATAVRTMGRAFSLSVCSPHAEDKPHAI